MFERYEHNIKGHGGLDLFYQTWQPSSPRGTILITHGLGEHSECYHHVAEFLTADNWKVVAWDMRGHGNSGGKRGFANSFEEFSLDLKCVWHEVDKKHRHDNGPVLFFGHSMGGLVALSFLLHEKPKNFDGLILSSPLLGLALKVPPLKIKVAEVGSRFFNRLTLWNEIHYRDLSRDEEMIEKYSTDPLRHDKISPDVFLGILDTIEIVFSLAGELTFPLLMLVAGSDKVVSAEDAMAFFDMVPTKKKQLHVYNEAYHELLNDLDRDHVLRDIKTFLNQLKEGES